MPIQIQGTSGMGNISNMSDYNTIKPHVVLWRIRATHADFEPTPGNYDYSVIEDIMDIVVPDGKYVIIQVNISDISVSPSWLYSAPYSVPIVTATNGQQYPYYFNSTFLARKQAMLDALRNRIKNTWSSEWKEKLIVWFAVDGKTGDEGSGIENVSFVSINGIAQPNPDAYAITSDEWNNYKKTQSWPEFYNDLAADIPATLMAVNPSNNGENWAWSLDNLENAGLKIGQPTHSYNNIGELFYANRCNLLTDVLPNTILFGELEQTNDLGWFQISTRQNMFALILSGIAHGNCSLNISPATFKEIININNSNDWWMYDFNNDFMGLRDASESDKAMIALRDCLDGANENRFPVSQYGPLINPSQQSTFNARYNAIINSSSPQELKEDQIATITAQFFNNTRRIAIGNDFPNLTFQVLDNGLDHDAYHQDGGVYMLGNYRKFINQYDPYNTCTGFSRIGPTNQSHGRNCCGTDAEMYFYFDNGIVNNSSYNVTFKIWYYNEGSRQWSLKYWNGTSKVSAGIITNTNTNAWVEHTFTINDFYGGGNINFGNDFSIKSEDGTITKIEIIRFDRISQNATGTSGVFLLGNTSTTVCDQTPTTLYTNGSFDVGKILYTDSALTTILTGYTFAVYASNNHIYNINTSTGLVVSDAGFICNSGTSGTYILGNDSGTVCAGSEVDLYTNGSFAVGKTLYLDNELINAVTGFTFVVNTETNIIYALNTSTGVVGAATGGNCTGGTAGTYKTGSDSSTVCAAGNTTLYTDGSFTIGSILYTDISLTIPATGFSFIVRTSNSNIYSVNSGTATVTAQVGKCNSGTSQSVRLNIAINGVCATSPTTVYTNGVFGIGSVLYQDINLINIVTGYNYVSLVISDAIYNLNTSSGVVGSLTSSVCNGGTLTVALLGNDITTVCEQGETNVYTDGAPGIGSIVYTDINLTTPLTGYTLGVRNSNGKIYLLDDTTGEILQSVGMCSQGVGIVVLLGNEAPDICGATPTTVYAIGNLKTGVFLYEDINVTTPLTGYSLASANGFIYNISPITGEVLSVSDEACYTGIGGNYQLSNTLDGICLEPLTPLYLVDVFAKGKILYIDNSLVTPITGYQYVVNTVTKSIYSLNENTGEIGRIMKQSCAPSESPEREPFIYKIVSDYSNYKNIIRAVLIDARATTMPKNATGYQIDEVVNAAIAKVTSSVIFYKLETDIGSIVGYFTLQINTANKSALLDTLVLRPAFQKNIVIITEQINNFIINKEYQNYII